MIRPERGFTLLELTVVLALIAVLAMVITPLLSRGIIGVNMRVYQDQLWRDVRAARAEALGGKRQTKVTAANGGYQIDLGGEPLKRKLPNGLNLAIQASGGNLVFLEDGESNGASLELSSKNKTCKLLVKEDGSFAWK